MGWVKAHIGIPKVDEKVKEAVGEEPQRPMITEGVPSRCGRKSGQGAGGKRVH